jgi:hypothetical protein
MLVALNNDNQRQARLKSANLGIDPGLVPGLLSEAVQIRHGRKRDFSEITR